jgi:hypothetical protein
MMGTASILPDRLVSISPISAVLSLLLLILQKLTAQYTYLSLSSNNNAIAVKAYTRMRYT